MNRAKILVIGGANIEYILKSNTPIKMGGKNFVDIQELFGGSGMNYTSRLLAYGEDVLPILFVGRDSVGEKIYEKLTSYPNGSYLSKDHFFVPNLTTSRSTIVVDGVSRTIFSQDQNDKNIFQPFVKKRLRSIDSPDTVIIGHIHSDRKDINEDSNMLSTSHIIDNFTQTDTLIYANLGASQLEYGFDFWKEKLKEIDILQLNIHELKQFIKDGEKLDLFSLINLIKEIGICAVITLDQFGALGIYRGERDCLFLARAITNESDFVDSTGAGDAFCAGMVSSLGRSKNFSKAEFKEAMGVGRSWASYACNSYGGANECPNHNQIKDFHDKSIKENEVMIYNGESIRDILALLDSMLKN
jgi:sugar/nucleoside kinase (ribokinase family)